MKYEDILTFQQRVRANRPTSEADINVRLMEEIAELRHYIEFRLPKPAPFFTWHDLQNNSAP